MSVRKIRQSWWTDIHFNGVRYRRKSPDNSKAGAQMYESILRQKLMLGESIDIVKKKKPEYPTFEEFAWKWHRVYAIPNNKASEISNKEIYLRVHLIPFFGSTKINKITNLQIEEFKAKKVKTNIANKTINNILTTLSKCLRTAEDWLELDKTPKIQKLKVPPQQFDFLKEDEAEKLLEHAEGIWHDVYLVLLKTGMRKGELLALTWENVDFDNQKITVCQSMYARVISSTKSNRIRYIDMITDVYKCLYARKRARGFVFADEQDKHFSMRRLNDTLEKVCKKAGLRRITVHTLRHTFASHLAMAGAPLQAIQGLLGHSDIQTTMRYAHLSQSIYKETIGLLEPKAVNLNFRQHTVNKALKVEHKKHNDNFEIPLT